MILKVIRAGVCFGSGTETIPGLPAQVYNENNSGHAETVHAQCMKPYCFHLLGRGGKWMYHSLPAPGHMEPSTMCVAHACSYMFSSPCEYWEVVLFVPSAKQYTWSSDCEICILLPYSPPHISRAVREQFLAWPRVHKNRRLSKSV